MQISRRSLLGAGSSGLLAGMAVNPAEGQKRRFKRKPKNIIFCVADGMALSTVTMCDHFRQITEGSPSYWATLLEAEYATSGLQETRSLNSLVTDSSAASSAWGSGRRNWNGQLNMYPDGTKLQTLVSLMKQAGVRCGLVTTTTITHATPAGFTVSCLTRKQEEVVAEEYLKVGVDVLLGGGGRFFDAAQRKDKRDLYTDFAAKGYTVVHTKPALQAAGKTSKLLGIFNGGSMPYSVDHRNSAELLGSKPTLREMTRVAIENLKDSPNGFLLQVEGARVDHAAHGNDLAALIYDQIEFEETVREVIEFALKDRNTLVVVTTDHATGGPSLNGSGIAYHDSSAGLHSVADMKASYDTLLKMAGDKPNRGSIQDAVQAGLNLTLTPAEADAVVLATQKQSPFRLSEFMSSPNGTLALVLGNHTKVTWTSQNHTSDHVLVTAVGPGRELFGGIHTNIDFFPLLLAAKDLKHENPRMDFATAAPYFEKIKHLWEAGG